MSDCDLATQKLISLEQGIERILHTIQPIKHTEVVKLEQALDKLYDTPRNKV